MSERGTFIKKCCKAFAPFVHLLKKKSFVQPGIGPVDVKTDYLFQKTRTATGVVRSHKDLGGKINGKLINKAY